MLQDFLSNRPAMESNAATETQPRNSNFQPFFAARAAGLTAKAPSLQTQPASARLEAPEIELVHEAGEVRRIIVTCTCCEKITIDCEY